MTDQQLYLAIGVPSLVAVIGILVNLTFFTIQNQRLMAVEARLDTQFNLLIGAITELDKRLIRVEIKLGIQP